jgi:general L-amino acid transport system permease protein
MLRKSARVSVAAIAAAAGLYVCWLAARWAFVDAIWTVPSGASSAICRAPGAGACWAVIAERFRFILCGAYPFAEQWRPAIACVLFVTLYAASTVRTWWNWRLLILWIVLPAAAVTLLGGGLFGLSEVPSEFWGGLPLTFLLSTVGFAVAFPLAVALALGRRSELPAIKGLCIAYIELVRGVPLVTFLFMAVVMFPLFVPQGLTMDKLLRAQVALVMVIAAYVAEVIRGGLQAIPKGLYEAAASVGLSYWPSTIVIVCPRHCVSRSRRSSTRSSRSSRTPPS